MYVSFYAACFRTQSTSSRKERFRQRVMHKFNYFVDTNDCVACVGCGRCVENCPVNLDVRQVLSVFAQMS